LLSGVALQVPDNSAFNTGVWLDEIAYLVKEYHNQAMGGISSSQTPAYEANTRKIQVSCALSFVLSFLDWFIVCVCVRVCDIDKNGGKCW
jgi:hypothetical protein